ncbi:MAG: DUF4097 family beta strand repeat-containing protein, partial [Gemmatimonadales bacterium]
MIRSFKYAIGASCALFIGAAPLIAQQDLGREGTTWKWDGPLASGGSLRLYNINGAMHFTPSSDGSVHVVATKHVHDGGDPTTVHYAVVRDGSSLVICAMWNDDAICDADGMHNRNRSDRGGDRRRNVAAEFSVQVPNGVQLATNTVNGDVSVERLGSDVRANTVNGAVRVVQVTGEVRARTVNGDVSVETRAGTVSGETVNGSVDATMGSGGTGDMRFRTVNGSITINGPAQLSADVSLSTLNGSIDSKYSLNFDRRRRHADGTVGSGGRQLSASTING